MEFNDDKSVACSWLHRNIRNMSKHWRACTSWCLQWWNSDTCLGTDKHKKTNYFCFFIRRMIQSPLANLLYCILLIAITQPSFYLYVDFKPRKRDHYGPLYIIMPSPHSLWKLHQPNHLVFKLVKSSVLNDQYSFTWTESSQIVLAVLVLFNFNLA